ncbi:MAG: iron-containing alcohol dehydrogenase [Ruminococcaceae bacterium]|nr:iron-containing alcohol dehydrogenase [Oscillospiraceae bacterium]
MNNFEFLTPTKVFFGKDTHYEVGKIIKEYGFKNILLHYGKQSIKKTGLYDDVVKSLNENGIKFIELAGVEPNPKMTLVKEGVKICRENKIDFILAVGGGSVIDSAKVIADSIFYDGEIWDFFERKSAPKKTLKVGTILTISASGSEMSDSAVITNEDGIKRGCSYPCHRPLFSILNPSLTFSVNKYQTACGIVDIMMHTMERYFSLPTNLPLTDSIGESIIKNTIDAGKVAYENPSDYNARATLMWAGALSHNSLTGMGKKVFMPCHQMEHEISGMYDFVTHGAGLATVWPAWAKYVYKNDIDKFNRYAKNVWGIEVDLDNPQKSAYEGIIATENFFKSIGMPTTLSELGIDDKNLRELSKRCTFYGKRILPGIVELDEDKIFDIYNLMK